MGMSKLATEGRAVTGMPNFRLDREVGQLPHDAPFPEMTLDLVLTEKKNGQFLRICGKLLRSIHCKPPRILSLHELMAIMSAFGAGYADSMLGITCDAGLFIYSC